MPNKFFFLLSLKYLIEVNVVSLSLWSKYVLKQIGSVPELKKGKIFISMHYKSLFSAIVNLKFIY